MREAQKRLGPMIFWMLAITVTAIACAALLYAAGGRTVNAAAPAGADGNDHFRLLLAGIEADLASGKLDKEQAIAAKGELAREMLRSRGETERAPRGELGRGTLLGGVAAVAALSFGIYALLGNPDLPARPLAERPEAAALTLDLEGAIARIEARLAEVPDDLRGWSVIAPAYAEMGRFEDAANAYRQVMALSEPTADLRTDLAEALLLGAKGAGSDEAMQLLETAAAADPAHARSRLYLASELMRMERYEEAARWWQEAIALANGDEAWLMAAQQGLEVARNDGIDLAAEQQAEMIAAMVGGLAERLAEEGGSIEEWMQLLRSYLVLGDRQSAQAAYDDAVAAYPAAFDRGELDTLALGAGLTLNGDAQ
ncbi:c-type cytochrome biogenesis protein CcmI [Devosia honganensis]|uniref:C-type cytochrome biogenesis protein CcmI n=1 Tax=Devosia honganensis TaxID=1610527 RepID=A0ABV7X1H2_9HYPH